MPKKSKAITKPEPNGELTVQQLKEAMPARQKNNITQSLVDKLNDMVEDPDQRDYFRENLITYASVLNNPKTKMENYVNAVKYCSFKLMGYTNQESWIKTFPERHKRLLDEDKDPAYMRSLVCAYNKGLLVNQIMEQSMVPTWILNQDLFQKALNQQATLMISAKSDYVRTQAADSLLRHLKQPEAAKVQLDVNVKQDDSVREMKETMVRLAEAQRKAIQMGLMDAQEVAESDIIEGEVA